METIYINKTPIKTYFFDDDISLLKKYSLTIEDSLPEYFRLPDTFSELKKGLRLNVEDIRDSFRDFDNIQKFIKDKNVVDRLNILFPLMSKKDIILLFLSITYKEENTQILNSDLNETLSSIRKIDKTLSSTLEITNLIQTYEKFVNDRRRDLALHIGNFENYLINMNNSVSEKYPIDCDQLIIEERFIEINFDLDKNLSLLDVFDAMTVSKEIPFLYTYYEDQYYFKVYKNIIPPEEWYGSEINDVRSRIHFKILNSNVNVSAKNINKIYSDGWWNENHNIEIHLDNNSEFDNKYIEDLLINTIGTRLGGDILILKNELSGIKTIFKINNFSFNKAILAYMIDIYDEMRFFLFLNEYQYTESSKSLTALTKNRFMCYFNPGNSGDVKNSLSITLSTNSLKEEDQEWTSVRVSRSRNYHEAESFRKIFCLLMSYYKNNYDEVFNIYKKYLPDKIKELEKLHKKKPKVSVKEDKKTGKRLRALKEIYPYVFRSEYSGMCQPKNRQPYYIHPSKVGNLKQELGEHKVMEFINPGTGEKGYYACEPREEGEPNTFIYPGLRKNTSKSDQYAREVPYLPCCFTEDQYTKTASALRKQIQQQKEESSSSSSQPNSDYNIFELENMKDIGHVLGYNKSVPIGRVGQLPYYMNFILKSAGYKEIEKGKQQVYPIFRYGVIQAPDSFLHCMEKAFNPRYSSSIEKKRIEIVRDKRKQLASLDYYSIAKQELYDYTDENIKNILLDENSYLDPGIWIRLLELAYNCNIFIFQTSEEYPKGALVIPRFSNVYLPRVYDSSIQSVFIMKNTTENNWPHQCEIFVKFSPNAKKSKISFTFSSDDPFVKKTIETIYNTNKVYYFDISKNPNKYNYKPFNPNIQLFQDAREQLIDKHGKTRMLKYDSGICLLVSPIPPLNIPTTNDITSVDKKTLKSFIHTNSSFISLDGTVSKGVILNLETCGLFYGFIPTTEKIKLSGEESDDLYFLDLLSTDKNSKLEMMKRNMKIADMLMQYTLFEYSRNPDEFSKDNFIVKTNHNYQIEKLGKHIIPNNKIIYLKNKIIVTSDSMRDKLISYLNTELLNDKQGVLNYKNKTILRNYYNYNDFTYSPEQLIFVTRSNLLEWIQTIKNQKYLINFNLKDHSYTQPYFYKNFKINKKQTFLVQNTSSGTLEHAVGLCIHWFEKNINLGYYTSYTPEDLSLVNYKIFSTIGLIKKEQDPSNYAFYILNYQNKYSALLRLSK